MEHQRRALTQLATLMSQEPNQSLVTVAKTDLLTLVSTRAVPSLGPVAFDHYAFLFVAEPTDYTLFGPDHEKFALEDARTPRLLPVNLGQELRGNRTGVLRNAILTGAMPPLGLQLLAEEALDVGWLEFELKPLAVSPHFHSDLKRLFDEAAFADPDPLVVDALATLIGFQFLRAALPSRSRSLLNARHPGVVRARKKILREYREPLSLADLAREAALSPSQFLVVFRKECHMTPHECLRRVRVNAAERLLQAGVDVTEAGFLVGFTSASGFRSAFRLLTGLSPLQYRALARR